MKQFKAEWQSIGLDEYKRRDTSETLSHIITKHSALCAFLDGWFTAEGRVEETYPTPPLFKAEDVEIVESWLPTFGTEQLMVYSIHIEFKTKEAAEQAREALLKLSK